MNIIKIAFPIILSCVLGSPLNLNAVRAWNGTLSGVSTNGSQIKYSLLGDEYYHSMVSSDGYLLTEKEGLLEKSGLFDEESFKSEHQAALKRAVTPQKKLINLDFPTIGTIRGLILLVEFADNEFHSEYDASFFREKMNAPGFSQYEATGSARDYFIDQSSGVFTPEFDVVGPIKVSHNMNYYGANDRNGQDAHPERMVSEACNIAVSDWGVDFSDYDFDNDGFVDFVYVIYAGYAESYGASSNTIWPHASQLTLLGEECVINEKKVDRYACSSELKFISGDIVEGIGTFCHEFSHVIGLPDVYDTRNVGNTQLGSWDLMDQGNYNNGSNTPPSMSAMERATLGWLELIELDTPSDRIEVLELNSSNTAYRISTTVEGEYFTLENRQQQGWDRYQPGSGLMIMHIAYEESAWNSNFVNSGIVRRYDLVEADGTQGTSQETDLFPYGEVNAFTDYSTPSSLTWDGIPTCKGVTQITQEDTCISFRFMKDRFRTPEDIKVSELGSDWFRATWSPVEEADSYRIDIREILSDSANPILLDENMDGMIDGKYPNADMSDISGSIDDYMSAKGWNGEVLLSAGGYLQLGKYGESGWLQSPIISMPEGLNDATLALQVVSYPGKSLNFTVEIIDASTYASVAQFTEKANKTEKDVVFNLVDLPSLFFVKISTSNERLFINSIRMLKGEVSEENIWAAGASKWSIEDIKESTCKIEGLTPGGVYSFSITTSAGNGWHASLPSEEYTVELATVGVSQLPANEEASKIEYFDLLGNSVSSSYKGVRIIVKTHSDGSVRAEKRVD